MQTYSEHDPNLKLSLFSASYQLSCEMHNMYAIMDGEEKVTIDPDGSGPLKPFNVICSGKSKSTNLWTNPLVSSVEKSM